MKDEFTELYAIFEKKLKQHHDVTKIALTYFDGKALPRISEREKVAKGRGGRVWEIVSPGLYEAALSNLQRRKIRSRDKRLLTCGLNCQSYK